MPETGLVEYNITDAAISEMKSIYMELAITDIEDKEQFDAVHSARMVVKGKRVEVEKRRKELKADALAWGKKVDGKAKEIFEKLEPIETHLDGEERKVTDEQKRIKDEADRKEKEKIEKRIAEFAEVNVHLPFFDVAAMTDGYFDSRLIIARADFEAEQNRLAEEEAARKAEIERLAVINAEMERKAEELAKKEAESKAESNRIASEKAQWETEKKAEQERRDREAFEAQAKENARIAAEGAAAEKAEREAREAKEKAEKEVAEKARQEALKPDREKLLLYADKIRELTASNLSVVSDEARSIFHAALNNIMVIEKRLRQQIKEL